MSSLVSVLLHSLPLDKGSVEVHIITFWKPYLLLYTNIILTFCIPTHTAWLTGFLDILGGAYGACALFNIGIFMVGKLKKLTGTVILVAALLIVAKT